MLSRSQKCFYSVLKRVPEKRFFHYSLVNCIGVPNVIYSNKNSRKDARSKQTENTAKIKNEDDPISLGKVFFETRKAEVEKFKQNADTHPYPHKFNVTLSLENFIEQYNNVISDGVTLDVTVSVAGRIHSIRNSGAKLIFYDLRGEGVKIQVMANARGYVNEDEYAADTNKIKRGDIIGIEGSPGKTKKGELSIIPKKVIQPLFRMKYNW
ncbi:lysine--tRNA ligase-like [Sitodiplosis mosellana]|uniref:lysine--tRNA ligase-like n=1 Tax=Sitodiplosis mosellana TaxID=263140 RepID=UPI002444D0E2|nr:lysine--tRNA ligase-like [Sitodiplosis mosellana]